MSKTGNKLVNKKVDKLIESYIEVPETLHFNAPSTPSSPTINLPSQNLVTDNEKTTKENGTTKKDGNLKDKCDANRFVTNLNNEINKEASFHLTDLDRQFISSMFHDILTEVTASCEAVTSSLNSKNSSVASALEKKFEGRIDALYQQINDLNNRIGALSKEKEVLVVEAKEKARKLKGEIAKRVNDHKEKKNHEVTKLKLLNESLKNDVAKLSQSNCSSSMSKKLIEEESSHKRTKELHKMKLSCKEEVIDILQKAKDDLV